MRAIELHGEMEVDYIVCPITPAIEAAIPQLDADVKRWADATVSIEDVPEADLEAAWRFATAEEGLAVATEWVRATNPDGYEPPGGG